MVNIRFSIIIHHLYMDPAIGFRNFIILITVSVAFDAPKPNTSPDSGVSKRAQNNTEITYKIPNDQGNLFIQSGAKNRIKQVIQSGFITSSEQEIPENFHKNM